MKKFVINFVQMCNLTGTPRYTTS